MKWAQKSGLVLFLFLASRVVAASGSIVEAEGEATMESGNVVAAKKAATQDALRRCVEQTVGIAITSEFTAEQKEVVAGNQSAFNSAVRDSITQKSEGFIEHYEVLSESTTHGIVKVKVRAKVYESKVLAETQKLAAVIAAAGNPKLMLVVQEIYVDTKGHKRVAKESMVAAHLEKELIARGFEVRGSKASKTLADDSIAAYDAWLDNTGGVAKLAQKEGADILIAGRMEVLDKGIIEDAGALPALKGQTRVEIVSIVRGIEVATQEVFSAKPVQMTSVGTNLERAVARALQGRGNNVVKQIFDTLLVDLKESFQRRASDGQRYVVALSGIKSFRSEGQGFLDALKAMKGVSSVAQQSFEKGQLILDVAFKGSSHELQQAIFTATTKNASFKSLDIESVSGQQLRFKL